MSPAVPPGPPWPRPVQTLAWMTRPGPFMSRARERYGPTFTVRIANEGTWVFVTDPDDIRSVFTADPELLRAGEANVVLRPVLGHQSVLLLDGKEHLAQRKLLLPPFHGERMQRYGDLITEVAEAEIGTWAPGSTRLWSRMQAVTLAVIVRAISACRTRRARPSCAACSARRSTGPRGRRGWWPWPCSAPTGSNA